jgi:hypothetical protein
MITARAVQTTSATRPAAKKKAMAQSFILRTHACVEPHLFGVQTIAEVVGDHAMRSHKEGYQ